ncbi:MAG: 16S rRNA methyltransferase [Bifidobacteriaceae bacterium]|nr:16S rRNA methyltransferase [Bifidobacteriaceae bacterium]
MEETRIQDEGLAQDDGSAGKNGQHEDGQHEDGQYEDGPDDAGQNGDAGASQDNGRSWERDSREGRGEGRHGGEGRGGEGRGPRRGWSAQAPSERQRDADAPRLAAYDLLRAVHRGAYANLALPAMLTDRGMSGRDAAFATELGYGAIRMRGQYDAVIAKVSGREQIDSPVMDVLRLGLHQIAAMRVPDHAAVAATVAIAREDIGAGPAGFVNAVLRAVTEGPYEALLEEVAPQADDSVEALAIRHSHPAWVVRTLRQALKGTGRDAADLPAVLAADNGQPPVTLAARPGLITAEQLSAQVEARFKKPARPGQFAPSAVIMERGAPGDLLAIRHGQAAVQDEGSQLMVWALAEAPLEDDQGDWLDLCAGPGGKAALLGGIVQERGGRLTANEPQPHRAELVRGAVRRLGPAVTVTELDGRDVEGQFDRVLVDVPCTGLGALRRRPEARWRHSPADLGSLGPLQRELLRAGLNATRPGGVLAYTTCSPHLAETRLVVQDVLAEREDAAVIDARVVAMIPENAVGEDGMVQLWTDRHGTDAMFLALIRRL